MDILLTLAEQKINQALAEGLEFNSPRWKNKALPEDDPNVPPELRMAYTLLKNSGFTPPELDLRKDINRLQDMLDHETDEGTRLKQMEKLNFLLMKLDLGRERSNAITSQDDYYRKIVERIKKPPARR